MAKRTITISEGAYERLAAHQRDDETISDVIKRLAAPRSNPLDSAGTYPGLGEAVETAETEMDADLATDR